MGDGGRLLTMVTKGDGGGGHNSSQNNYHTITFFSRKSDFYDHFQRKNSFRLSIISFKRTYVNCSLMMISWEHVSQLIRLKSFNIRIEI